MSILTSLFVESIPTAKERCSSSGTPLDDLKPVFNVGSVLNEESLASLLCIVRNHKKYNPSVIGEIKIFDIGCSGERVLYKAPEEIVAVLAKARIQDISKLARTWKKNDPYFSRAGGDVTIEHLKAVLLSMRDASRYSMQLSKPVLIYVRV